MKKAGYLITIISIITILLLQGRKGYGFYYWAEGIYDPEMYSISKDNIDNAVECSEKWGQSFLKDKLLSFFEEEHAFKFLSHDMGAFSINYELATGDYWGFLKDVQQVNFKGRLIGRFSNSIFSFCSALSMNWYPESLNQGLDFRKYTIGNYNDITKEYLEFTTLLGYTIGPVTASTGYSLFYFFGYDDEALSNSYSCNRNIGNEEISSYLHQALIGLSYRLSPSGSKITFFYTTPLSGPSILKEDIISLSIKIAF